jgi:hypothetical protein
VCAGSTTASIGVHVYPLQEALHNHPCQIAGRAAELARVPTLTARRCGRRLWDCGTYGRARDLPAHRFYGAASIARSGAGLGVDRYSELRDDYFEVSPGALACATSDADATGRGRADRRRAPASFLSASGSWARKLSCARFSSQPTIWWRTNDQNTSCDLSSTETACNLRAGSLAAGATPGVDLNSGHARARRRRTK